jgi:hypothetical protein
MFPSEVSDITASLPVNSSLYYSSATENSRILCIGSHPATLPADRGEGKMLFKLSPPLGAANSILDY